MPAGHFLEFLWLVPLLPLFVAVLLFAFRRVLHKSLVTVLSVGSALVVCSYVSGAVWQLFRVPPHDRLFQHIFFEWFVPGIFSPAGGPTQFVAEWGMLLDPLSAIILSIIAGCALLIHLYSAGFLRAHDDYYRFSALLNLAIFFATTLLLANNLLVLFLGWGGVAVTAYLLVGFEFNESTVANAALKLLIPNFIGDAMLLLAICLIAVAFGTIRFTSQGLGDPVTFPGISQTLAAILKQGRLSYGAPIFVEISALLFLAAFAKCAQFPFFAWLPNASEAPTPAVALANSVAFIGGVYLVVRLSAIERLAPSVLGFVAVIGILTAILGALMALAQNNVKKVLACSTISQFGLIFFALGIGAFSAGVFQLMTHVFAKTLLFLAAGAVTYALSGEDDLRKMGGLYNTMPQVSRPFMLAALALCAIPPFAGFFSVDGILRYAFHRSQSFDRYLVLWLFALLAAFLTALYAFRLFFQIFRGRSRVSTQLEGHIKQPPASMTVPLSLLTLFVIVGGWFALPTLWGEKNHFADLLAPSIGTGETLVPSELFDSVAMRKEYFLMAALVLAAAFGIWLASRLFLKNPKLSVRLVESWPRLNALLAHKFHADGIASALLVDRMKDLSLSLAAFDDKFLDGFLIHGSAALIRVLSRATAWFDDAIVDGLASVIAKIATFFSIPFRMLQTGRVSAYAALTVLGFVILLGYYGHHMQHWVQHLR